MSIKDYRAIGNALGKNEHSVGILCHRVVRSDGSLEEYFGKLNSSKKIVLLQKEDVLVKDRKIVNFKKVLFK